MQNGMFTIITVLLGKKVNTALITAEWHWDQAGKPVYHENRKIPFQCLSQTDKTKRQTVFRAEGKVKRSRMSRSDISTPQMSEWSLLRCSMTVHELLTGSDLPLTQTHSAHWRSLTSPHPSTRHVYFTCLLHKETPIVLFQVTPLQWGLHEMQQNTELQQKSTSFFFLRRILSK